MLDVSLPSHSMEVSRAKRAARAPYVGNYCDELVDENSILQTIVSLLSLHQQHHQCSGRKGEAGTLRYTLLGSIMKLSWVFELKCTGNPSRHTAGPPTASDSPRLTDTEHHVCLSVMASLHTITTTKEHQ
ncbi:hypothetical protein E2C01_063038 [Portunus trituberculatus]|uniref:Uncharacterized protein n=1 Tax=Portunus trituberculatus TaxID=210409 RepID=A0A5B7HJ68_PORTR|nr:hypothetical protein [Portunus trituberculatus]